MFDPQRDGVFLDETSQSQGTSLPVIAAQPLPRLSQFVRLTSVGMLSFWCLSLCGLCCCCLAEMAGIVNVVKGALSTAVSPMTDVRPLLFAFSLVLCVQLTAFSLVASLTACCHVPLI